MPLMINTGEKRPVRVNHFLSTDLFRGDTCFFIVFVLNRLFCVYIQYSFKTLGSRF